MVLMKKRQLQQKVVHLIHKSQLPEQPMPNQQVIQPQQAAITQSGLTPTESALLSPAEQQIRLKQRGLA
jgi:hypothetical protein